jgi:hypothetical protein
VDGGVVISSKICDIDATILNTPTLDVEEADTKIRTIDSLFIFRMQIAHVKIRTEKDAHPIIKKVLSSPRFSELEGEPDICVEASEKTTGTRLLVALSMRLQLRWENSLLLLPWTEISESK